ncbi:hypothetical protein AB0P21_07060 [Kribbella sp. NPDC056861]
MINEAEGISAAIRRILERPEPRPVESDEKGWPKLGSEQERHDDLEQP